MDDQGNPVHSVGVATDVTASRLAADELRMLKESAESANRAKDHFLAVLSHELRTPLTPVLATVQEVLRDRRLTSEIRERLNLIQRNVELEARLIDDLLDVTRITRGKMELHRSEVDVHQILEHALRTCDADFRGKRITVQLAEQAENPRVFGDRARLLQVFWNLLKNAAKFTPPGQSVEVQTSDAPGDMIRIDVRDTGVGIEPPRLDSIFNAFEQGSAKVTRQYGGLGLGLSIGKALVELHGGTISATSDGLGCGACFTVQIPQATVDVPAKNGAGAAGPKFNHRDRYPSGSPTRLLLIEDHPDTSRVMARLLRDFGYEVTTAGGVADALRVCEAAQHPFNIAVSDIGLPDGSGLDLVRQLRARYPMTAAIALSGFGMEDDRMRSLDAGCAAHLTKPVDLFTLQSVIEQVVNEGANASSE
jgi:CheY-like chemotaxis protein